MVKVGYDNRRYIETQSAHIRERIGQFGGKLYLEFGGKLFDDYHAARVLPGFEPDSKVRMLQQLKDDVEIVVAICAGDIEKNKVRGDLGIPYEEDVLRLIDEFRAMELYVGSVVVTQYSGQPAADAFLKRLNALGVRTFRHYPIAGYPHNVELIVSEAGYGRNDYIETSRPLVVVTAPGPGSGKMATCLSQLYHEHREAATADLNDVNMIDPFHLEAYGITTVNYNRDVEVFPVLRTIFESILGQCPYQSPTDMGVNMVGSCIVDDEVCREASHMEILRRYYAALTGCLRGTVDREVVYKLELLMKHAGVTPAIFPAVAASLEKEAATGAPAGALVLPGGRVITGKTSDQLGASASLLLNALKALGGIDQELDLISTQVLEPICRLKTGSLGNKNPRLHSDEVLIALCVSALTNPIADLAQRQLPKLKGCGAHFTVVLSDVDENLYKRLGMHVSYEAKYERQRLYYK